WILKTIVEEFIVRFCVDVSLDFGFSLNQHQNKVNEIKAERLARTANPLALVAQQQLSCHPHNHPTHYTNNSSTRSQQAATRNREKAIVNSPPPTYDQEPKMFAEDDALSKDKEDDDDLANERDLLASLIEKLKCEINDSKNRNKFLKSSNKALVNKLKESDQVIRLEKESRSKLSDLVRPFDYAKLNNLYDLFVPHREKSSEQRFFSERSRIKMKKDLFAHQETISIMSQQKKDQTKAYKTREEKELEKVTALENKIKVFDDIVCKTGQSVQTMNMLNRNCKTSFVKPEFLKKAQRANPCLYDICCYNDNLALMLAPESEKKRFVFPKKVDQN
nr:hypothetical protein [Tanacetum cinerariifolium]